MLQNEHCHVQTSNLILHWYCHWNLNEKSKYLASVICKCTQKSKLRHNIAIDSVIGRLPLPMTSTKSLQGWSLHLYPNLQVQTGYLPKQTTLVNNIELADKLWEIKPVHKWRVCSHNRTSLIGRKNGWPRKWIVIYMSRTWRQLF